MQVRAAHKTLILGLVKKTESSLTLKLVGKNSIICIQDLTWLFSYNNFEHYNVAKQQFDGTAGNTFRQRKMMLFMNKTIEHGYL